MLHGGGRVLEDMRILAADDALRRLLGGETPPSSDATGNWLRRMGTSYGVHGLGQVRDALNARIMRREERRDYTLDADATAIEAWKRDAAMTYKEFRGYMPMLGFLAENEVCIYEEFREGNESPNSRQLEFYTQCVASMPKGRRIARYRADSAHYQARLINRLDEDNVTWAIAAPMNEAIVDAVKNIRSYEWRRPPEYKGSEYAWCPHAMNATKKGFMLSVKRTLIRQPDLYRETGPFRYHVVATNIDACTYEPWEAHEWYNERSRAENLIKEVKSGFGMEYMPCGESAANAVWFRIGVLAYNLFVGFKRLCCPEEWHHHTVATFRWRLFSIAGYVVYHARQLRLRLKTAADIFTTVLTIQDRIAAMRMCPG